MPVLARLQKSRATLAVLTSWPSPGSACPSTRLCRTSPWFRVKLALMCCCLLACFGDGSVFMTMVDACILPWSTTILQQRDFRKESQSNGQRSVPQKPHKGSDDTTKILLRWTNRARCKSPLSCGSVGYGHFSTNKRMNDRPEASHSHYDFFCHGTAQQPKGCLFIPESHWMLFQRLSIHCQ